MNRETIVGSCVATALLTFASAWGDTTTPMPSQPGTPVELTATPVTGTLSQPGWDVKSYPLLVRSVDSLDTWKRNVKTMEEAGVYVALAHGEPDINYIDHSTLGALGVIATGRAVPGYHEVGMWADTYFGFVAKGWINFPVAGHYSLGLHADDMAEVAIGGQVLFTSHYSQWGTEDINGGTFIDLNVSAAGIYPIQLLWYQSWGSDAAEFYRRIGNPDQAVTIGTNDGSVLGLTDHPMVYGLLDVNGTPTPASDLISTYETLTPDYMIDLDLSGRVGDVTAGTGNAVFTTKTVTAPLAWYGPAPGYDLYYARDSREEQWSTIPMRFLDFLGDINGASPLTYATVNFNDGTYEGLLPDGNLFPGLPAASDQFACRIEGFATFPAAGLYYLAVNGNDQVFLRIGRQTISSIWYGWTSQAFVLNVQQAGTYPICLDSHHSTGDANIELVQLTSAGAVPVNGSGSTITVHESAAGGPYAFRPHGFVIPADRKLAPAGSPPGSAGVKGWDVTLVHTVPGVMSTYIPAGFGPGLITANNENDFLGSPVQGDAASDAPDFLDYTAPGTVLGRFGGLNSWSRFSNWVPDVGMAAKAVGYIEFPQAGDYGLNTSSHDGVTMWIAGQVMQCWPWHDSVPQDNIPVCVHVDEPGIYDIRIDYGDLSGGTADSILTMFQLLPDGTAALVNSTGSTVTVYRSLNTTPTLTTYHNPVRLPAAAKVADLDQGITPGLHAQVVNFSTTDMDVNGGMGHDNFYSLEQAMDLTAAVLDNDPIAMLNQHGVIPVGGDAVVPALDGSALPGSPGDFYGARFTGYIGLAQGGHVFTLWTDDGYNVTIGGLNVAKFGGLRGADWYMFYVYAPVAGFYPIRIDYWNFNGSQTIQLLEYTPGFVSPVWGYVNIEPTVSTLYVDVYTCPTPFADADGDGDVDQDDFGAFQTCFTGTTPATLTDVCRCFDRDNIPVGDGDVDALDLAEFDKCWTGPAVDWSQILTPDCNP